MKRERVLAVPNLPRASAAAPDVLREATKLRRKDVWTSLFMIVGVPYLKRKLDDAYEIHAGGAAANLFGASYQQRDQLPEGVCSAYIRSWVWRVHSLTLGGVIGDNT